MVIDDEKGLGENIWSELYNPPSLARTARIRGLALSLAGCFIKNDINETVKMHRLRQKYGVLFDWIKNNRRAGVTISQLAEAVGLSKDSLSKSFSRDMGCSLKTYMNKELIKEASQMIAVSNNKMKEIAFDLNFNDEYYFSRFFTRQTGISPGEYRKRYHRDN